MKRLKKFVNYKQVEEFATFFKKDLIFTLEDNSNLKINL
jgi:hypothetical protein